MTETNASKMKDIVQLVKFGAEVINGIKKNKKHVAIATDINALEKEVSAIVFKLVNSMNLFPK
jgi:hypothetical protein